MVLDMEATNREQTMTTTTITEGTTVHALYPNAKWGEGIVSKINSDPASKPLTVTRSDGTVGHFYSDQVEVTA